MQKYKLVRHKLGFFEVQPKPSDDELKAYYTGDAYHLSERSESTTENASLSCEYGAEDELAYVENVAKISEATLRRFMPDTKHLLELGCGAADFSNYFHRAGWNITCNDYSDSLINKINPQLIEHFILDDADGLIKELQQKQKTFGLINLNNLLEHLINPLETLLNLKQLMAPSSVLRITVPNDYSGFQQELLKRNATAEDWLIPPEHLSYFNLNSLKRIAQEYQFKILSIQTDYPIEQFLINEHSNYRMHPDRGFESHKARVICTNYLVNKDIEQYIKLTEAAAELEFGRNIIIYLGK